MNGTETTTSIWDEPPPPGSGKHPAHWSHGDWPETPA